jgi:hypothetical protein
MEKNKSGKYLKYAIGEIILVVIGILIALSVNNWNEERKSRQKTVLLLEQVQKELLYNIKNSNSVIDYYRGKDSLIFKVLNGKVTYEDYTSNPELFNLVFSSPDMELSEDAFKNLIEYDAVLTAEQDSIRLKLKDLYGTDKKSVADLDVQMEQAVFKFLEKLENEKEWYSQAHGKSADEAIAYFLTDPFYLNRVTSYSVLGLNNHFPYIWHFRNKSITLYEELSANLDLKKDSLILEKATYYNHYIGDYTDGENIYSIKRDKTSLVMEVKSKHDSTLLARFKLYPDSKTFFTMEKIFGQLTYDENNEVDGFITSGDKSNKLQKIK